MDATFCPSFLPVYLVSGVYLAQTSINIMIYDSTVDPLAGDPWPFTDVSLLSINQFLVPRSFQMMKAHTVLLDEPCNILHESYVLSCKVSNLVVSQAPIDIYIRLRGFENDSPLILFRDFENRMKEDLKLNLIFSIENDIGAVLQIDFVMDVPDMEDDIMVASLTEVELSQVFKMALPK